MTPATILRDACVAGLVLALAGYAVSPGFAGAVAMGALGAILNLWLLSRVVQAAVASGGAGFMGRLALKQLAGLVILGGLVGNFPVAPVLVGFCSVLLALSVRGFLGLLHPAPSVPSPMEHG